MVTMTMAEVNTALEGKLICGDPELCVSGVSRDSRQIPPECLFFPLIGEVRDGHEFLGDVVSSGCRAFVISDEAAFARVEADDITAIKVNDTTEALQKLAKYYLSKLNIRTVGVTGSTGKTTTKEMIFRVLKERFVTGCNNLNYNNHIGLPLTVLDFDGDVEVGVLEMGMDRPGEIDFLTHLVEPDIGVITNIGVSHIEHLKSRENIFKAKMEIVNSFGRDNLLIACKGEHFLRKENIEGDYDSLLVGTEDDCDLVISDVCNRGEAGTSFTLAMGRELEAKSEAATEPIGHFELKLPGLHNILNASLAVCVGLCMGVGMEDAARALEQMGPTDKRGGIENIGGIRVIDDTYNAGPDSMKAAIDVLMGTRGKRHVAILGDMFELGDETSKFHKEIGEYARNSGVEKVICIGDISANTAEAAGDKATYFKDKDSFYGAMVELIREGDIVLLKGSRGMAMEEIIDKLKEKFDR